MKRLLLNHPTALAFIPLYLRVRSHTMVPFTALYQTAAALKDLEKRSIEGAVVELGSWKGGCGVFMQKVSGRATWLFDSFKGLSAPTAADGKIARRYGDSATGHLKTDKEEVYYVARKLGVSPTVVKGWVHETLPRHKEQIGDIALLRLDLDLYEPTKIALEELYDQVMPKGYVIIDDFNDFGGCRKAVYEFFCKRGIAPKLMDFPYGGEKYFIKPR